MGQERQLKMFYLELPFVELPLYKSAWILLGDIADFTQPII
jgi:hypothetical protein